MDENQRDGEHGNCETAMYLVWGGVSRTTAKSKDSRIIWQLPAGKMTPRMG